MYDIVREYGPLGPSEIHDRYTEEVDDRNTLFTTPHILCTLATHEILSEKYVDAALTYYVETKGWDAQYVAQLRQHHLDK